MARCFRTQVAMNRLISLVLVFATSLVSEGYAEELSPHAQRCIEASMVVESIGKLLAKSQVAEADRFLENSDLAPVHKRNIKGMLVLIFKHDPKIFTTQYSQQMSQNYYLNCIFK